MHAITIEKPGEPDVLLWNSVPDPEPGRREVLLDVVAAGVNRADLMQRQGFYPPPKGAPPYLGLEVSGRISQVGPDVTGWKVGDEACALLSGGGYAERVAVPAGQLLPVPHGVSLVEAAALPEVACTVWSNVFMLARLAVGETFLVHGGAGGIGTMAIQLGHAFGAKVVTTAGSQEKLERCRALGADVADQLPRAGLRRDRQAGATSSWTTWVRATCPGMSRPSPPDGRLVVIGLQGGGVGELNLGILMAKRAAVHATSLRARPLRKGRDRRRGTGSCLAADRVLAPSGRSSTA